MSSPHEQLTLWLHESVADILKNATNTKYTYREIYLILLGKLFFAHEFLLKL